MSKAADWWLCFFLSIFNEERPKTSSFSLVCNINQMILAYHICYNITYDILNNCFNEIGVNDNAKIQVYGSL